MTPNKAVHPASPPPPAGSPSSGNRSRPAHKQSTALPPCHTRLPHDASVLKAFRPRIGGAADHDRLPPSSDCTNRAEFMQSGKVIADDDNDSKFVQSPDGPGAKHRPVRILHSPPARKNSEKTPIHYSLHPYRIIRMFAKTDMLHRKRQANKTTYRQPALHTRKDASPYNGNAYPEHPSRQNPNAQNL